MTRIYRSAPVRMRPTQPIDPTPKTPAGPRDEIYRAIMATYEAADDATKERGISWYPSARAEAQKLGERYGVSRIRAAAVIAALSPRAHWSVNLRWAEQVLAAAARCDDEAPRVSTELFRRVSTELFRRVAFEIACGESAQKLIGHMPKVWRFYRNICGSTDDVTVDVWATRAAGIDADAPRSKAEYAALECAYRRVALDVGLTPRDLQAVVWLVIRPERTADPKLLESKHTERKGWFDDSDIPF